MLSTVPIRRYSANLSFNSGNLAIDSPVRISTTMEGHGTNIGFRPEIALTANVHPSVSDLFWACCERCHAVVLKARTQTAFALPRLAGLSNSGRAFSLKTMQIHDLDLRKSAT